MSVGACALAQAERALHVHRGRSARFGQSFNDPHPWAACGRRPPARSATSCRLRRRSGGRGARTCVLGRGGTAWPRPSHGAQKGLLACTTNHQRLASASAHMCQVGSLRRGWRRQAARRAPPAGRSAPRRRGCARTSSRHRAGPVEWWSQPIGAQGGGGVRQFSRRPAEPRTPHPPTHTNTRTRAHTRAHAPRTAAG